MSGDNSKQLARIVEARIVELMTAAVEKSKARIATAVIADCSDPLDRESLTDALAEHLGCWDFNAEIELDPCGVTNV